MQILKDITAIITAMTTILGFVALLNKATKGKILTWLQKPVLDKLDEHGKRLDQLELNDLKQIIMNDNIPLSERVTARREVCFFRWKWRNTCTFRCFDGTI